MCIPLGKNAQAQSATDVGTAQVGIAHAGKTQFGGDMTLAERAILLREAAHNLTMGQRGADFKEQDEDRPPTR